MVCGQRRLGLSWLARGRRTPSPAPDSRRARAVFVDVVSVLDQLGLGLPLKLEVLGPGQRQLGIVHVE